MEDKIIIDYECITKSATALEGITIDKETVPNIAQELKTIETEHDGLELNTQALNETAENLTNVDTKIKNLGVNLTGVVKAFKEAVKKLSDCDIAIGTTAGIGRGGITIITNEYEITTTTDINTDLRNKNSEELYKRSESGIKKTIEILLLLLNNDFEKINSFKNIEIIKK